MTGMTRTIRLSTTLSTLAIAGSLVSAAPALAQTAADEPEAGTIVVTARKAGEDILKVPVTVTALTSEAIAARGIATIVDVAASTPGININNNSSGHADRSFQQIILRGFTPSGVLATTTSMFIDGVAVASPSMLNSVGTPERVEVLKGPQSAYFGRNTFAGAINIVNKVPTGEWAGAITAMAGTRKNYRLRAEIEGPIIGDLVTFRLTGERNGKNGSWKNASKLKPAPTVMKNSPKSRPLKGARSLSNSWRNSELATTTPARKVPRAGDRPTMSIRTAMDTTIKGLVWPRLVL